MLFGIGLGGGKDLPVPRSKTRFGSAFQARSDADNTTSDSIEEQTGACWSQTAAFSVGSQQIYTTQLLTWTLLGKEGAY
jgi:hypothetical protein